MQQCQQQQPQCQQQQPQCQQQQPQCQQSRHHQKRRQRRIKSVDERQQSRQQKGGGWQQCRQQHQQQHQPQQCRQRQQQHHLQHQQHRLQHQQHRPRAALVPRPTAAALAVVPPLSGPRTPGAGPGRATGWNGECVQEPVGKLVLRERWAADRTVCMGHWFRGSLAPVSAATRSSLLRVSGQPKRLFSSIRTAAAAAATATTPTITSIAILA